MIGHSEAFRVVRRLIDKIAACDAPVLIEGESGPHPHPGLIEVSGSAAVGDRHRALAGAGDERE
jgi:hypothetical protein